jgi:predicted lipid carrier protein YhbT
MVLVHRESQVQQFQLSVISVKQIPSSSTILACPAHVLPQPVQRCALLCILLWIISICLSDILLQRLDPVYLVGLLEGSADLFVRRQYELLTFRT